ncbi:MAG: hypothetical protein RR546_05765 [Erysipelotrichaceae bacterium]
MEYYNDTEEQRVQKRYKQKANYYEMRRDSLEVAINKIETTYSELNTNVFNNIEISSTPSDIVNFTYDEVAYNNEVELKLIILHVEESISILKMELAKIEDSYYLYYGKAINGGD